VALAARGVRITAGSATPMVDAPTSPSMASPTSAPPSSTRLRRIPMVDLGPAGLCGLVRPPRKRERKLRIAHRAHQRAERDVKLVSAARCPSRTR
jgi:hypothetical protein